MGISLSVTGDGISFAVNLKDAALPVILQLVQKHRDGGKQLSQESKAAGVTPTPAAATAQVTPTLRADDTASTVLNLKSRGAAEALNEIGWEQMTEKILLLGAWHEARGGETPWQKAEIKSAFEQAREKLPGNLSRDIGKAVTSGWVNLATARSYTITRTGWNKIGAAFAGTLPKAP
jgi:hypothetical protein